jgi:REP element-mobilizing transposase RayT
MGAPRSQRSLDLRPRNRDGSVTKKLGRPRQRDKHDPAHVARPEHVAGQPVHVVLRVTREVGNLRTRHAYRAIRGAIAKCAGRTDYRVVHASIQSNHVHLLVEADDKHALTRGMQGFAISAAKRLNRELRRTRGDVFPFRYHATPIKNPTQARNAIAYILNNWRRHRADARAAWRIDPYSSAEQFPGWATPHGYAARKEPLPCVRPTSWLLTDGWTRARPSRPIRFDEVPGPDPTP